MSNSLVIDLAYISVDAYVVWIYKANDMASILNTKGYAVLDPVQSSVPLYNR